MTEHDKLLSELNADAQDVLLQHKIENLTLDIRHSSIKIDHLKVENTRLKSISSYIKKIF